MEYKNCRIISALVTLVVVALVGLVAVPAIDVAVADQGGTGPDDALTPAYTWKELDPGKERWYAFHYKGDGSQITVRLEIVPEESATFAVWTPEGIERWRLGLEANSIGMGSPERGNKGVLTWSGNFNTKGTYYVVLEHSGSQPGTSYYLLEVKGDGVSLSTPPPAAPKDEPAKSTPKPAKVSKPTGRLVFQTAVGGPIYTINVNGKGLQRVADGIDPVWSPNGQQIAFVRWQEPRGVWVIDSDGSGEWRAFDWGEARWPSWSPDGDEILFSRQQGGRTESVERCFWKWCFTFPPDAHWKIGIVRLHDGYFYEPPASNYARAPDWSPDGKQIVFADEHGLRIQTLDREVFYLITHDVRDTSPVWSPDGTRVAFTRRQHDHWEVYVVDADGRNLKRLTHTPKKSNGEVGHSASPAWSPDGQHIAFLTDRLGKWEIWVVRANGVGLKPMFPDALDGLMLEYGSVGERAISWTK
jgi:dipeptidyl aminopeptidase/acylaminoacyl peptidase